MSEDILKDITIVNKYQDQYKLTHKKAFWSSNDGISILNTILVKKDGIKVIIFWDQLENYVSPEDYEKTGNGWTLRNDDYIIKGIVSSVNSIAEIKSKYECIKIINVANKDYGSLDMQHFEINGE